MKPPIPSDAEQSEWGNATIDYVGSLEEEIERLRAPYRMTTEVPKVPGLYAFKESPDSEIDIARIAEHGGSMCVATWDVFWHRAFTDCREFMDAKWGSAPLPIEGNSDDV